MRERETESERQKQRERDRERERETNHKKYNHTSPVKGDMDHSNSPLRYYLIKSLRGLMIMQPGGFKNKM